MQCLRCQGLLSAVQMRDLGQPPVLGWRCLLCGAMTDPGIEANKASHNLPAQSRARLPGALPARLKKTVCGKQ
ncbi:MAG: hypothetical protein OEV01_14900 [Nitrospira sp.]|nr:hypothetical protein [Nitrospira sp.]